MLLHREEMVISITPNTRHYLSCHWIHLMNCKILEVSICKYLVGFCFSIISACMCAQLFSHVWPVIPGTVALSVHGISQARILEWVDISFSRGSSQPRNKTSISCISSTGGWILYWCTIWESPINSIKIKLNAS